MENCPYKLPILLFLWLATLTIFVQAHHTRVGFYNTTCPNGESIVFSAVQSGLRSNPRAAPGIVKMFFHDCFVNECDASILIDGPTSEKIAPPNIPTLGYDIIDAAKARLEAICPGVVSCADIIALAARDSVVLTAGRSWKVPTGRRDGLVSRAYDSINMPAFNDSISVLIQKFRDKGLNIQDLVILTAGGHTIGRSACASFSYRLYNFNNTNRLDPDINPSFLPQLRAFCPKGGDASRRVDLDTGSANRFDTSYFLNLKNGRGVLESDAKLWTDSRTQQIVQRFLGIKELTGSKFDVEFGRSMVKMGNIELKTGNQGEIRRVCTATN